MVDIDIIAKLHSVFTGMMDIGDDEVEDIYARYRGVLLECGPTDIVSNTMSFVGTLSPREALILGHIMTTVTLEGIISMEL